MAEEGAVRPRRATPVDPALHGDGDGARTARDEEEDAPADSPPYWILPRPPL